MRNLKSLLIMAVFLSLNFSQQSVAVDLDKLSFTLNQPGMSFTQDRYIDPEHTDSSLNYFSHLAFWAGAKTESGMTVVSGDGNPTVKEFTEWQFDTPTNNDVVDNVDYDPSGNNLYFTYDRLEKLGDITAENNIMKHSKVWSTHFKTKNKTKPWLGFAGRVGDSWVSTIFLKGVGVSHPAALMPPFRRGWKSFEVDYTSFGNELGIIKDKVVKIIWVQDPTYGD